MKKTMVTMMVAMMVMVMIGTCSAGTITNLEDLSQEELDIMYLYQEELSWCMEHGMEDWVKQGLGPDGLYRGCGMVLKTDIVFWDATPDTINAARYGSRLESILGDITVTDVTCELLDIQSGYGIYRIRVIWTGEITEMTPICKEMQGIDCILRFYN